MTDTPESTKEFLSGWVAACAAITNGVTEMRTQQTGPVDPNEYFLKLRTLIATTATKPEMPNGPVTLNTGGDNSDKLLDDPLFFPIEDAKLLLVQGPNDGIEFRTLKGVGLSHVVSTICNFLFNFAVQHDLEIPLAIGLPKYIETMMAASYGPQWQQILTTATTKLDPDSVQPYESGAYL